MEFTKIQQKAIQHPNKRIVVNAGPGTGKTRVLTQRIVHLIKIKRNPPSDIMALTFTNKAANEIKERLRLELDKNEIRKTWVGTFHGLFYREIVRNMNVFDYEYPPTIYTDDDIKDVIRSLRESYLIKLKETEIFRLVSSYYQGKIDVNKLEPDNANCLSLFERVMGNYNALWYPMILYHFNLKLLNDGFKLKMRNKHRHILIDEFQDTDALQASIIRKIDPENLFVIGDLNQSIYEWRNCKPEYLVSYLNDQNFERFDLDITFRLPKKINEVAWNIISKNKDAILTELKPKDMEGEFKHINMEWLEAEIGDTLAGNIEGDTGIFCRTNSMVNLISDFLDLRGVKHLKLSGDQSIFREPMVRHILAYFKLLRNPNDVLSLFNVIKMPQRYVTSYIHDLIYRATKNKKTYYDQFTKDNRSDIFMQFKRKGTNVNTVLSDLLIHLIYDLDVLIDFKHLKNRFEIVNRFASMLIGWENNAEDCSINGLLEWIYFRDFQDQLIEDKHPVKLMTLHSCKGLEFDNVYIVGLNEGYIPHSRGDISEERRLYYVGVTRAKKSCTLISWQKEICPYSGKVNVCKPSIFL